MFEYNPLFPNATDDQKWEQIRLWRNFELSKSDWTQLEDSKVNKESWSIYRQSLRDLPQNFQNIDEIVFPISPNG